MSIKVSKEKLLKQVDSTRYRAYFDLPVLGDRTWLLESDTKLSVGDRIEIETNLWSQVMKSK